MTDQPSAEELRRRVEARLDWETQQVLSTYIPRSPRGTAAEAWFTLDQLDEIDAGEKAARVEEARTLEAWRVDVVSHLSQRSISTAEFLRQRAERTQSKRSPR